MRFEYFKSLAGSWLLFAAAQHGKIQSTAGRKGIQCAAGVRHGDGNDCREQQSSKASRHLLRQKNGQNPIGGFAGSKQRNVLRKNKKQDSDQEKYSELEQNDEAAGDDGAAAVPFWFVQPANAAQWSGLCRGWPW